MTTVFFSLAIKNCRLGDDRANAICDGNDPSGGSGGDDVARVAFPFGVFCDEGVGATVVEGAAQALRCSGQRFLPIRKLNAVMSVIRERSIIIRMHEKTKVVECR
jgi:hypothetical protein